MEDVEIRLDKGAVYGTLSIPKNARSIIVFAHGSGSSRFSPRNRFVAEKLQSAGFATLLMDLLTKEEDRVDEITAEYRFNIELLAERLISASLWLSKNKTSSELKTGYFGASTGAAAALIAAAKKTNILAVVSRGGRPDLAMKYLSNVKAATLLIVGGDDEPVIGMNKEALAKLKCIKKLEIVKGATHLFEEPGKLEIVSKLAIEWFKKYLV